MTLFWTYIIGAVLFHEWARFITEDRHPWGAYCGAGLLWPVVLPFTLGLPGRWLGAAIAIGLVGFALVGCVPHPDTRCTDWSTTQRHCEQRDARSPDAPAASNNASPVGGRPDAGDKPTSPPSSGGGAPSGGGGEHHGKDC